VTKPISVLVVDDSSVVRGLLSKLINAEPDMKFVGSAANGKIGVEKAVELKPDVIVLDVEMPVMTGIEALRQLRSRVPGSKVIMFSTLTAAGAKVTMEALALGAADYAPKPSGTGSSFAAADQVRTELLSKVRALAGASSAAEEPVQHSRRMPNRPQGPARTGGPVRVDALVLGSSTGGPAALEAVLPQLPVLRIPIFVVQHMPATFTNVLAGRLDNVCEFPVTEAVDGELVKPGQCYIAAGGFHMRLERKDKQVFLALDEGPKIKSCRPSVDALFDSAHEAYGGRLTAAMLTGMGDDGLDSCRRISPSGIEIIAQDQATSVVWGMPGAITKAGLSTQVLPLNDIPAALVEAVTPRTGSRKTEVPSAS
jgi:two-component system chemotaxis response regulator CheB